MSQAVLKMKIDGVQDARIFIDRFREILKTCKNEGKRVDVTLRTVKANARV